MWTWSSWNGSASRSQRTPRAIWEMSRGDGAIGRGKTSSAAGAVAGMPQRKAVAALRQEQARKAAAFRGHMNANAFAWFIDRHIAAGQGERPAFVDASGSLTYASLRDAASRVGTAPLHAGLRRVDRLELVMEDSPGFAVAFSGRVPRGGVHAPARTRCRPAQTACVH